MKVLLLIHFIVDDKYEEKFYLHDYLKLGHKKLWWYIEQNDYNLYYVENETKKLLYVVCSRAKKNIYLFSEQGRVTQSGKSLTPTNELLSIDYSYDKLN